MSPTNVSLPLEIIIRIAQSLYDKEYFPELESVLYIFPQIEDLFSCHIPTIAVVGIDQYDKYSKFIHSRARPFGSKDLFIIKQKEESEGCKTAKLESECYMILGSKQNKTAVSQRFEFFEPHINVTEISTPVSSQCNYSSICYELISKPNTKFWTQSFAGKCKLYPVRLSMDVAELLKCFLQSIKPKLLRIEIYSDYDELSLDAQDLYQNSRFISWFTSSSEDDVDIPTDRDSEWNPSKCSFEIIKDVNKLTSLYQFSILNGQKSYHNRGICSHSSYLRCLESWLIKSLWNPNHESDKTILFGLFSNLKDVTIDKISYQDSNDRQINFLSIDCSKSSLQNTPSSEFLSNYTGFTASNVPRLEAAAYPNPAIGEFQGKVDESEINLPFDSLPHYIRLFYKDFCAEKLQTADITIFDPNSTNSRFTLEEDTSTLSDDVNNSNDLNLRGLEFKINSLLDLINQTYKVNEGGVVVPDPSKENFQLSQTIMSTIIHEIYDTPTIEGLNKFQPFRLRVFDNQSNLVNRAQRIHEIKESYRKLMT